MPLPVLNERKVAACFLSLSQPMESTCTVSEAFMTLFPKSYAMAITQINTGSLLSQPGKISYLLSAHDYFY